MLPCGSPHLCALSGGNEEERQEDVPLVQGSAEERKEPAVKCQEGELEKAKKDSLFDNLRDTSAGGSGGNNLHDLVGNIQEMYPGLSIRLVRSQSVTPSPSRKKSEDDEVQILNGESTNSKKEPEAGTSSSTSNNFKGSCPLCGSVFESHLRLETHASSCNGHPAASQV